MLKLGFSEYLGSIYQTYDSASKTNETIFEHFLTVSLFQKSKFWYFLDFSIF